MNHIVSFSTGLSSALTVERVCQKYDSFDSYDDSVSIVFMDTLFEDDDNYRFMADCRKRWRSLYGRTVTVLVEGRTPYEVSHAQHVIPNSRVAPCTARLKIEVFVNWVQVNLQNQPVTIHIGYDYSEVHRVKKTKDNYAKLGWETDFPLMWKPIESRSYSDVVRDDWGVEPPRMYGMGYSHANCGGRCVKQGKNDWLRTLKFFPERYAWVEAWEEEMRQNPVNADYTIANVVKGGVKTPITLKQLRLNYESQMEMPLFDLENEMCVVCGIGDIVVENV